MSKLLIAVTKYFHGSSNPNIIRFQANDDTFALLGTGVYFYRKKDSAAGRGDYVYEVKIPSMKRIAPKDFKLDVNVIGEKLGITDALPTHPAAKSFVWWATDGWNEHVFANNLTRKEIVNILSQYMVNELHFDGMLADYPNGGEVLVLWKGAELLTPVLVPEGRMARIAKRIVADISEDRKLELFNNFWNDGRSHEKGITDEDVDPKQLEMGIKVEHEHSPDDEVAERITLDHLAEIDDYYTRLKTMEDEAGVEE